MFAIMPYIYSASRMVMMESPMHLFWLLYSLYFFRLLKDFDKKNAIFSGVFLGLSIATKFNSAVLIPVSLFILGLQFIKSRNEKIIWSVFYITGAAIVCFGITYIPLLLAEGTNGIINTIRAIKDVLLERNSEGKIHVVNDQLFQTSPWWFYLYYIYKEYSIITILVAITGICYAIYKKSTFSLYWLLLLLINVMFFQALTLKNARYISTMEVSLVILIGIFISDIYKKYPRITFVLVVIMLSMRIFSLLNMKPNSYNALYLKMKDETSNFKTQDRIYIFGSIRTSRWYFDGLPEDLVISRKDFDVMSAEFPNFKYIAIDPVEEIKNPNNLLTQYIKLNEAKYAYMDLNGINLYTRK
jgi:4-amino-4-deoxy-L-arabinose transferase-like glycosyltransferase